MGHMEQLKGLSTNVLLLERIKDTGNDAAWAEFYDFYWDLALGWTRGFGCAPNLAKDIFQETMMTLIKTMPEFSYNPAKGHFRSYLKSIIRSRLIDLYRKERKYVPAALRPSQSGDDDDPGVFTIPEPDAPETEEYAMDLVWMRSVIRQAIRQTSLRVDATTYKSFKLHMLENRGVEDTARKLNISANNVYDHKRRFLAILKDEFGKLVRQFGGEESHLMAGLKGNASFEKALEEFLSEHSEFADTGVIEFPPQGLLDHLQFISGALRKLTPPKMPGAYLCHIIWSDSAEPRAKKADARDSDEDETTRTRSLNYFDLLQAASARVKPAEKVRSEISVEHYQWIQLEGAMRIGRNDSNNIVLPTKFVSGLHASVTPEDTGWRLRDEHSSNGTFLNGKIVESALLKDGDIIQITTNFQFVFYVQNAPTNTTDKRQDKDYRRR